MRKTIIADTSCFIVPDDIGEFDLLRKVYGTITTTKEVAEEFGQIFPDWVEYKIVSSGSKNLMEINGFASNQLIYLLSLQNGQMVQVVQEKTIPAIHEERDLFQIGGLVLKANNPTKYIIQHGKFIFSGLICNDLLDIDNRQPLRGQIDALIVIEWNPDISTYDSLVKSTSNDLHCFVIQVNNRQYGDTRLRGPYKAEWERDKVSVRGGGN